MRSAEHGLKLDRSMIGGVGSENPFSRGAANSSQICWRLTDVLDRLFGIVRDENFTVRFKELIKSLPAVGEERGCARGGLKQTSRRTVAHGCHRAAGHAEIHTSGAV